MSRPCRKLLTVDQGQALRRRAIQLQVQKRIDTTATSPLPNKRWMPKMPRKLKKRLRRSFESTFLTAFRKTYPNAPEPSNRTWRVLWCRSWRAVVNTMIDELHDNLLEQMQAAEDRSLLQRMRAAAAGLIDQNG